MFATPQTPNPASQSRGCPQRVNGCQLAFIVQTFGDAWIATGVYSGSRWGGMAKVNLLSTATQWVVAKYGSQDPWRALQEDVPEPDDPATDAAGAWTADYNQLKKAHKFIRANIRAILHQYERAVV